MPKVSVNISCYNSEPYIYETIKSVLDQTFGDFEIIVIDDGSTDNTEKILKSFHDERIKYLYQDNRGLAAARNRALSLSSGEYIAFLDHDDIWLPSKLEKQVLLLETRKDVSLVYSNFFRIFPNGRKVLVLKKRQPEGMIFEPLLYNYPIGLLTAVVRKQVLEELVDIFDENLKILEDYDVFMRVLYRHKAAYIKEPLATHRIHGNRATLMFQDRYADEYSYVAKKFEKLDPFFMKKYSRALIHLYGNISHLRAKMAMTKQDKIAARGYLSTYKVKGAKFLLLYLLAFLPPMVWNKLHDVKNKGVLF
jgi:glycosyltransferase involved in cell wall biosynthesis